mmetsp:Transcript_83109/g.220531  ORF Transcript_83109/g.220531 Transcript_83109/m.220531 type:complete len:200 (+) Transcript_83109:132-731(+)
MRSSNCSLSCIACRSRSCMPATSSWEHFTIFSKPTRRPLRAAFSTLACCTWLCKCSLWALASSKCEWITPFSPRAPLRRRSVSAFPAVRPSRACRRRESSACAVENPCSQCAFSRRQPSNSARLTLTSRSRLVHAACASWRPRWNCTTWFCKSTIFTPCCCRELCSWGTSHMAESSFVFACADSTCSDVTIWSSSAFSW